MPKVLTTNAQILCPHGGMGASIPSNPKWTINGGIVLLDNDRGVFPLTGPGSCQLTSVPCTSYTLKSMELNATQVDGRKVILDTDFNRTNTGLPLIIQESHQVFDNSTVTPIPPGQTPPPLPAELADLVRPTVQPEQQPVTYDSTSHIPSPLVVTFTLASDHPLQWILILLDEQNGTHLDVTNGLLPQLVVVPPGGSWQTLVLVITVTMTPKFLSDLLPGGRYHFFMTAVSCRGLPGHGVVDLQVL